MHSLSLFLSLSRARYGLSILFCNSVYQSQARNGPSIILMKEPEKKYNSQVKVLAIRPRESMNRNTGKYSTTSAISRRKRKSSADASDSKSILGEQETASKRSKSKKSQNSDTESLTNNTRQSGATQNSNTEYQSIDTEKSINKRQPNKRQKSQKMKTEHPTRDREKSDIEHQPTDTQNSVVAKCRPNKKQTSQKLNAEHLVRGKQKSQNSEPEPRNTRKSSRNKKVISDSDEQLFEEPPSPHLDTGSSNKAQKLTDQDLLVRYNKRLDHLKKNNIFSTTQIFQTLCTLYERSRNDTKAAAMSKYMRNKFQHFGIPTPQRKALNADLWKDVKKLSPKDLRTLAHQTWFSEEREFHYFTVGLLEREVFRLYSDEDVPGGDLAIKTLNFVKMFIEHPASWWDTVDVLSSNVVGLLVRKYPSELLPEMDKWNNSPCFWVCRASILYQLSYKQHTDADRLFRYCLNVASEEEFFIRKAIGWALRQYYRKDPASVRSFVHKHKTKLSTLSVKEALKHDKS